MPVQVRLQRTVAKGFFARFPSAFIYPFRGSGVLMLLVSAVVISFAEGLTGAWMSIPLMIAAYGYIFSFLQNIIHATANEEEEVPGLPGFEDVFGGAFRLAVTVVICFGLPVTFAVLKFFDVYDAPANLLIATMVLGCLYFPMAFLAVAMKDTALAANPLVVIPAILKVPLGYLVTCMVVIGVYLLRLLGDALAGGAESVGYSHPGYVGDVHDVWLASSLEPDQSLFAHRKHAHAFNDPRRMGEIHSSEMAGR